MTDDKDDQKGSGENRRDPRLPSARRLAEGRSDNTADSSPAPLRPSAAMRTYLRPTKLQPPLKSGSEKPPVLGPSAATQDAKKPSKPQPTAAPRSQSVDLSRPTAAKTPIPANDGQERMGQVVSPPPPLPPSVVADTDSARPLKPESGKPPRAERSSDVTLTRPTPDRPTVAVSPKSPDRTQNRPVQAPPTPAMESKPEAPPLQTAEKPKIQKKPGLAARLFGRRRKGEASAQPVANIEDEDRRSTIRREDDEPQTHPSLPPIDTNVEALPARPVKVPAQPRLILENVGLEIRSLGKHFKKRPVLRDVSLRVQRGEAVGLLGPNGAGKTTCFYIVTGLIPADYGEIFLDGQDITSLPMYRRARMGIGYLPQEASIFRGLTVEQNIRAVLELVEKDLERRETALESLLAEFSISHLRRTPAIALSGGERRRLEIARALASQPNFILLDEPLAGIDPIAVRDIRDLVSHLKDRGIGVLITDHNVRETLEIVDRAYILHDGNVLMEGPPEEIVANQEVRRVYLGDRFTL